MASRLALALLCLAAGGALGWLARDARAPRMPKRSFSETREGGWRFVNPLLECEGAAELIQGEELSPFRARVEETIRAQARAPGLEGVSVYFRELNDGIWFSVGATERFTPASLRKVPMMIAVLKQAEREPDLLDRPVPFRLGSDYNAKQTLKPSVTMTPGQSYAVGELVRRMIVYSDNNAFMLLSRVVDPAELDRTYAKLDARPAGAAGPNDFLSVQTYAAFFRILFNASYLGKERSEQALSLLAQTEFRAGLASGLPADVPVAHKFGEHRDDAAGKVQLHDCGIVYFPERPYLLCVMSRGTSFEHLDDVIAAISKAVFDEVKRQQVR